jgi:hypothetical protein
LHILIQTIQFWTLFKCNITVCHLWRTELYKPYNGTDRRNNEASIFKMLHISNTPLANDIDNIGVLGLTIIRDPIKNIQI